MYTYSQWQTGSENISSHSQNTKMASGTNLYGPIGPEPTKSLILLFHYLLLFFYFWNKSLICWWPQNCFGLKKTVRAVVTDTWDQ